jgi:hypothetical protein
MVGDFRKIPVPKELESEVAILVEQLKKAAVETGEFKQDDVELIKPKSKQFGGPEVKDAIVYVALPVLGWVTKTWLDAVVKPIVERKLKRMSKEFVHWVNSLPRR